MLVSILSNVSKIAFLQYMIPCVVRPYLLFRLNLLPPSSGLKSKPSVETEYTYTSTLNIEATGSSETLVEEDDVGSGHRRQQSS
jgi:hypothetical protein